MVADFFYSLEAQLIAHIKAACPRVGRVAGIADGATIATKVDYVGVRKAADANAKFGAVFVFPHPDYHGAIDQLPDSACSFDRQRWILAVATSNARNVEDALDGQVHSGRADNSVLVSEVLVGMASFAWKPQHFPANTALSVIRKHMGNALPGFVVNAGDKLYVTMLVYETDLAETS